MTLPHDFLFGVATSAYQSEGGFNGPGQPANNWASWELSGRIERSGAALGFWDDYSRQLDRAVDAGCNAFRFSIDWTRCEPAPGAFDEEAFARYGRIADACRERGLEPVIALHHFAHPRWLGPHFWLRLDSPDRFASWAAAVAARLSERCRYWLTINEPNVLPFASYVTGRFPPGGRLRMGDAVRALGHLLAAHLLAYRALHQRRPDAVVSLNNHALSVYELDRLLLDVLVAPSRGIDRGDLHAWLSERRGAYHQALPRPSATARAFRMAAASALPLGSAFPRALALAYECPDRPPLDLACVNLYDPDIGHRLRIPGRRSAGGRDWSPTRQTWEDAVRPDLVPVYLRLNHEPGLDLWVTEAGLCNRVTGSEVWPRRDGWTRERFLRAMVSAVETSRSEGLPVSGFFHWTLADNYEWGSYEPRFGLYRADRGGDGPSRWAEHDATGTDAAGTFRRLVEGALSPGSSVRSTDHPGVAPSDSGDG